MTLQRSETLRYGGRDIELLGTPLDAHIDSMAWPPMFKTRNTAVQRGYEGSWDIDTDGVLWLTGIDGEVQDLEAVRSLSGWIGLANLGSRGRAQLSAQAGAVDIPLPDGIDLRPDRNGPRRFFTIDDGRFVVSVLRRDAGLLQAIPNLIVHLGPNSWDDHAWASIQHGIMRSFPMATAQWIESPTQIPTSDPWQVRLDVRDVDIPADQLPWMRLEVNLETSDELPPDLNRFSCWCLARIDDSARSRLPLADFPCFQSTAPRPLQLDDLFTDRQLPIEADWFTGTLRTGDGGYDAVRRAGFSIRYERETILQIENGRVVTTREQHNEVPNPSHGM